MPKFCQICGEEVSRDETECSHGHEVAGDFNYTLTTPADMVREYAEAANQPILVGRYATAMGEEYDEWHYEAFSAPEHCPEKELKEIADLVYVSYARAREKGYNLDKALERIHQNNMGRMYQPDGTILRRDDGKVLKNKDYPKVELGDLV